MNAPTLLVGLGGTGSEIVQRVYESATPKQRQHIGFVIFDTDVNELRAIEEKTPQIRTVQTSTRLTVGEYLDVDRYSRDNWFPVNRILNGKALTEGAGQVRAVSRLAINTAIQQGKMAPLNEAIEDLYKLKGQKTVQAPRVILVGSLCGGTGSGLILPVALYIRNFLTTKLQQSSAIIRGFFLLPEVFEHVIKTQSERNNLRSNAYAAVREIDAFMTKDDGSLSEKYDLHFMAPRAGSAEPEEYTGRPMDFCFLFDAQNLNGMKLNSFEEYKAHAANCIYGMAIAPTSKRSNSSEDNVIREIVFAGGRNRFAGAGSSMLVYPVEDMKRYLALTWTKDSISEEWLEVDRRYYDELKTSRAKRKKGYQVAEIDRGRHYVDVINQGFSARRAFDSAIRNLCYEFSEDGFVETGSHWGQYFKKLDAYIEAQIAETKGVESVRKLTKRLQECAQQDNLKKANASTFEDWYSKLQGYKSATIKCTGTLGRNIGYSLFRDAKDQTRTEERYRLEYWLHKDGDPESFLHPNAVRFFLYNVLAELQKRAKKNKTLLQTTEEFWETFEKNTFDLKETEDHQETESEYYDATYLGEKNTLKRFLKRKTIEESKEHLTSQFSKFYRETSDYWVLAVQDEVYREAINYVESLCKAFHGFYDVLEQSIGKIDKELEQLEQKYTTKNGEARRFVCADATCMKGLAGDVVNHGSSLDLPGEMTAKIFQKMKAYALAEKKPEAEDYFITAFNDTVVEHLTSEIMNHHASKVDMDIITALEMEAYYSDPETNYNLEDQRLYAKHAIESTEILAKPFIESPVGKEPRVIPACAYNPALTEADFPGRRAFVAKNLKDLGGVTDEGIERNMILFYQAVYDLRANELSKFAPPKSAQTYERTGGEYYKAYYELIQQIHPETQKSKVITPHINRWWHVISKMPDLDEGSQIRQEMEIHRAFFWGMLGRYIELRESENGLRTYELDRASLSLAGDKSEDKTGEQLVVSNGTPCDHLYEVQDAFTIYPKMVKLVLGKIHARIDSDLYKKTPLEESFLYELLTEFCVEEYPLVEGQGSARSVFELPLLMKHSIPAEDYYEDSMIQLTDTILEELKNYLVRFCDKKDLHAAYANLVRQQFDLFISNTEAAGSRKIFSDSLFIHICKIIAKLFEDLNMKDDSNRVKETVRRLEA